MRNVRTKTKTRFAGGLLLVVLAVVVSSCGPGGTTGPTPQEDGVSVQVVVTGPGRVVQGDFTCEGDCAWAVTPGETVAFEAEPTGNNVLVAWGGVCPPFEETCAQRFSEGDTIEATFAPHALRLDLEGDGEGLFRIVGPVVEATCEEDCGIPFSRSLQHLIRYESNGTSGTILDAWTGACSADDSDNFCYVTPTGVTTVGKTWRHPPVATSDGYATFRNGSLSVDTADGVLANDTDTDGDPLTAILVPDADVTNGTLTLRSDGSFDYEPEPGFAGDDRFRYRVKDAFDNTSEATNVTIAVVDRVPAAAGDSYVTGRATTLAVDPPGVLENDTDPDGDPLTAVLEDDVTNGTLTLNADGSFTYEPGTTYVATDAFTYRASDGTVTGNLATVTITITNAAPEATADTYSTPLNTPLVAPPIDGVLANDTDANGDALTATLVDDVTNGTLTLATDGSFTYTPNTGFVGNDSFTYVAGDGVAESPVATVTITITNDPPTAAGDSYVTGRATTLAVDPPGVLENDTDPDGDPLTAVLEDDVTNGTLTLNADGSFTYEPGTTYVATDAFTYRASDGTVTGNLATVTITITNAAPEATADTYSTPLNTPLVAPPIDGVLANDTDANGDALTATLVDDVTNGTLTLATDGSFTYTPNTGFVGNDSFTYVAGDGVAESPVATVTITITNDPPTAAGDTYSVVHDTTLTVAAPGILGNDTDPNGDPLTAFLVDDSDDGTLTLSGDGSFAYAPDTGFIGTDGFSYAVTDGAATSAPVAVTISVTNVAPVATTDSYGVAEEATLNVNAENGGLYNNVEADGGR